MIEKIRKRDGAIVTFDKNKIGEAIWKAAQAVGGKDRELAYKLADEVIKLLEKSLKPGEIPSVEQVQDLVEKVLVEHGHYRTAKAYITYRKMKEEIRKEKIALLGEFYEEKIAKRFSINAIRLMVNRYLQKNEKGELIEGPKQMFERVAALIVIPDILYDERIFDKNAKQKIHEKEDFSPDEFEGKLGLGKDKNGNGFAITWNRFHLERMKALYDELNEKRCMKLAWSEFLKMLSQGEFDRYYENFLEYFNIMVEKKFLPNSPTLFNAGAPLGQLSACFVIDIEDNMESIMESAKQAAMIFKSGGGIGINYSKLRPEGDRVSSTGGTASGPVSFMRIIDVVTDVVKQGGCISLNSCLFTDQGILPAYALPVFNPKDYYPLPISVFDGKNFTDAFFGAIGNAQEMLLFHTEYGYELKVTHHDLIATVNKNGEIIFKPACEIKTGDYLVLSLGNHTGKKVRLEKIGKQHFNANKLKLPAYLTPELAEILGIYMADGCFNSGRLLISFSDKNIFNYFSEKIKQVFGLKVGEIRKRPGYLHAMWFSKDLEKYFEKRGWKKKSSTEAFIPLDILRSEKQVLAAFLRALFEGDGYVHSHGYPVLYTTSKRLARDTQIALLSLGILSRIRKTSAEKIPSQKGKNDVYTVFIVEKESVKKFLSQIGFISKEKNEKAKKVLDKKFEYVRVIPFASKRLRKIYENLKREDKKLAHAFYRKAHKYMLGYRNFTFNVLKRLEREFPVLKEEFKYAENFVFAKVKDISSVKEPVFHIETLSGKYVSDGFLVHNKRRGANMGILECWHPDIMKFIHAKDKEGEFENFNISVMLDQTFWEAWKKSERYPLINPRTKKVVAYLDPRKFLEEVAYLAWKTGDPGVLFKDNINRRNVMLESKGEIRATNPCVTGDTLIVTDHGLIRAKDLKEGMKVWTLNGWSEIERVFNNGVQKVYEVELENGMKVKVTKDHKFLTESGWKKLEEIKEGEKIRIVLEEPEFYQNTSPLHEKFAELLGYWIGSKGLSVSNHVHLHVGKEKNLAEHFANSLKNFAGHAFIVNFDGQFIVDSHRKNFAEKLRKITGMKASKSHEKRIPEIIFTSDKKAQAAFLRGLFSADGSVYDANETVTISLSSTSKKLLEEVQVLLCCFGIYSTLTNEKKETYRLLISGKYAWIFREKIGLLGEKMKKLEKTLSGKTFYSKEKTFIKIKSIKFNGEEEVFDIKAPPAYTWVTNGIYSYDCGEEPLYPYESCNLGSINLYAFIKKENGKIYFDWKEYDKVVQIAYRFLDNIIDVNKFPLQEIENETKARRKIGLGIMGLASTLFALRVPYNSEEGFDFTRKVCEHLTYFAMLASVERAKQRGVFPEYDKSSYVKGEMPVEGFYHKDLWSLDWEKLRELILKHGIRNVEVTTIAPTGSISMFFDVSSGIEPQFALVFEKRVVAGEFFYVDVELENQLKEQGLYREEILKKISENGGSVQGIEEIPEDMRKVFVTALDLPWWDHIRAQAVAQLWVTTSISKTINMPEWVSSEDVHKAYIAAHEMGCKGITIYREGSKTKQVIYLPGEVSHRRIEETVKLIKNDTPKILKKLGIEMPEWYKEILEHGRIKSINNNNNGKCPNCGSANLIFQGGCVTCKECGWSKCVIA